MKLRKIGSLINGDISAILIGLGLSLTIAMEIQSTSITELNNVYAIITAISRACALVGSYFSIIGLLFIARIPWAERSIGHEKLVRYHRKLGPWSLC